MRFPAAEVVTGSFEDWPPPGPPHAAVMAFSALHWIDPGLRYAKPFDLLRPGGAMVVAEFLGRVRRRLGRWACPG